jgi:magnesium transporter
VADPAPAAGDPQTPGAAATSVTTAQPPACPTRTRLYHAGILADEGFPAEQLSEQLASDDEAVVWLGLHNPTPADLQIVVNEFGLHPLAVEDAISRHQRAKVDWDGFLASCTIMMVLGGLLYWYLRRNRWL